MSYSKKNLRDVNDSAVEFGIGEAQEARFPREDLGAETTGLAYHVVHSGKRQPFGHRHDKAEEVYVVMSGSGRMKLDDEIIDVGPLDAIRVEPQVIRSFEAGDDDLALLAFGPRHAGDGEVIQGFWTD